MRAAKKAFLLFSVLLPLLAVWPMQPAAFGASVTYMDVNVDRDSQGSYFIAGKQYSILYFTDKASTTSETSGFQYSWDGVGWDVLPTSSCTPGVHCFRLPIDPYLTTAYVRINAMFEPILGSRSSSQKTFGPVRVLQPGEPSDFTATANDDGSVTLNWNDNSNMESYYRIIRSGPDGEKTFDVGNATDHVGPLQYVDKSTNKSKKTYYHYKIATVIDKYALPEELQPGLPWAVVMSKVPVSKLDIYKDIPLVQIEPDPDIKVFKYLDVINLNLADLAKPVTGVQLDKKAIELKEGDSAQLTATVSPADAANKKVAWSSSHPQYAEVDASGKVTAKSAGSAIITATTENGGRSDTSIVTVLPKVTPKPPEQPAVNLADIEGHKAKAEIVKAVELGIVSGYANGKFVPDGKVTRAEFATMLVRALKPEGEGAALAFKDKDKIGTWAVPAVKQAVRLGFIRGYADGTFRPNANITHSEMISMVIQASGLPMGDPRPTGFADDAEIPDWARPAVSKGEEVGIIIVGGLTGGNFLPKEPATRAEAASAIVKMLEIRKS